MRRALGFLLLATDQTPRRRSHARASVGQEAVPISLSRRRTRAAAAFEHSGDAVPPRGVERLRFHALAAAARTRMRQRCAVRRAVRDLPARGGAGSCRIFLPRKRTVVPGGGRRSPRAASTCAIFPRSSWMIGCTGPFGARILDVADRDLDDLLRARPRRAAMTRSAVPAATIQAAAVRDRQRNAPGGRFAGARACAGGDRPHRAAGGGRGRG